MDFRGRLAGVARHATNCPGQAHYPDGPTIAAGAAESTEDRPESRPCRGRPVCAAMQAVIALTGLIERLAIVMVSGNGEGRSRAVSGLTDLASVSASAKTATLARAGR